MKRLMTQPQRIFGHRVVKLVAGGTTLFGKHRFIAAEGPKPIARGGLARGGSQITEQIVQIATAPDRDTRFHGSGLEKMQVRVDKPRGNRTPRKLHQVSSRT